MPSGFRKTQGNHFEIYYEQPWGGVASDKDPADIEPNQLVQHEGLIAIDGVLKYTTLAARPDLYAFVGVNSDSYINTIFQLNGLIYAIDQYSYVYILSFTPGNLKYIFQNIVIGGVPFCASDGPWFGSGSFIDASRVINEVAYISSNVRGTLYMFTATGGVITFTIASTYVGGKILGVIDEYLLQFNVNQQNDNPTVQPTRVNWSGPDKFSTWDPSVDRTAGYNTITAIGEDQLTAFFTFGSVGLALSQKGLIQLSPTGIAIEPFSFSTLWLSDIGEGCIYPATTAQYGPKGFLLSNNGAVNINTSGLTDISLVSKKAILDSLQLANQFSDSPSAVAYYPLVAGGILLYLENYSHPNPFYMLAGLNNLLESPEYPNSTLILWLMDIKTGAWYNLNIDLSTLLLNQYGLAYDTVILDYIKIFTVDTLPITGDSTLTSNANPVTLIVLSVHDNLATKFNTIVATVSSYKPPSNLNPGYPVSFQGPVNLIFREEEIKLGREPTIRRVVIKAVGSGTLNLSVSGVSFGSITMIAGKNIYKNPFGIFTGTNPQLTITSTNFVGQVTKIMMAGTFADGEID